MVGNERNQEANDSLLAQELSTNMLQVFTPGAKVQVEGLQSVRLKDCNGMCGVVVLVDHSAKKYGIRLGCGKESQECGGRDCGTPSCSRELGVPAHCITLAPANVLQDPTCSRTVLPSPVGASSLPSGTLETIEQQGYRECAPTSVKTALGLDYLPTPQAPKVVGKAGEKTGEAVTSADYASAHESSEVLSYYMHEFAAKQLTLKGKVLPSEPSQRYDAINQWMEKTGACPAIMHSFDHYFTIRTDVSSRLVVYDHLHLQSTILDGAKAATVIQMYAVVDVAPADPRTDAERWSNPDVDLVDTELGNDEAAAQQS